MVSYIRKSVAVVSLMFLVACEDDAIPVPLPPPPPPSAADVNNAPAPAAPAAAKPVATKSAAAAEDDFVLLPPPAELPNQAAAPAAPAAPVVAAKPEPVPAPAKEAKSSGKRSTAATVSVKNYAFDDDYDVNQLRSGTFTIQIGIFPSESSAKALVRRMSENGINSYYAKVNNPAKLLGSYYRVRVGFFNARNIAESFARNKLAPLGYTWWIDYTKNDGLGNPGK